MPRSALLLPKVPRWRSRGVEAIGKVPMSDTPRASEEERLEMTDPNCPLHGVFEPAPTGTCSCPPKVTYVDALPATSYGLKLTSDKCELNTTPFHIQLN